MLLRTQGTQIQHSIVLSSRRQTPLAVKLGSSLGRTEPISRHCVCCSKRDTDSASSSTGTRRTVLLGTTLSAYLVVLQHTTVQAATSDLLPEPAAAAVGKVLKAPGEFLKSRQRADGGAKLLAPIRGSRMRLQDAEKALQKQNIYEPDPEIYKRMLGLIRSASLNCHTFEAVDGDTLETRASILQRQLKIGDACTFRLIHKNVVNLLTPSQESLKSETTRELQNVIQSFEMLDDAVFRARLGETQAVERIPDLLTYAIASNYGFETCIERCLGLPPSNRPSKVV